jgi:low temperature requirement protein LtrA
VTAERDGGPEQAAPTGSAAPAVGFLELFYDLVFVAATMVVSNVFSADVSWSGAFTCALLFALLWLLWFHTTTLANVERTDDLTHRVLVLVQMFFITLTVVAFANRETSASDFVGITYAVAVFSVAYLHHRAAQTSPQAGAWARRRRDRLVVAGLLVLSTGLFDDRLDDVALFLAIVVLVVPSALGSGRKAPAPPVDVHHLVERGALLTLIMCGEAFVKVGLVVSTGTIEASDVLAMVVEFVGVFAIFFIYFDDIPKAGVRPGTGKGELWALAHLPLHIGIVGVAIGISKFLQTASHPVHDEVSVILGVSFALVYAGLAVVGSLGLRTPIGPLTAARLGALGVVLVLSGLSWGVGWFTPGQLLVGLAVLAVAHAALAARLRRSTTVPAVN